MSDRSSVDEGSAVRPARPVRAPSRSSLERLTRLLDAGILMIHPSLEIDHLSPRAQVLLDLDGVGDPRWKQLASSLREGLEESAREGHATVDLEILPRTMTPQELGTGAFEIRRLRIELHSYDEQGGQGHLALVHDRRVLESVQMDLEQAARLRAMTRIYMGVVHDLKAPMNAMALNLELLRGSLGPGSDDEELPEKQKRWVQVIAEELRRLQRSLEAVLEQTAPDREIKERFDLAHAIEEIENLVAAQAKQQAVEIDRLHARRGRGPVWVEGLRDRIKQAILTLTINALEALGHSGGALRFDLRLSGDDVVVSISDTGPGIPSELHDHIFEMRFTTKPKGTGIGLYVARNIIENHGGTLRLVSSDRRGTTFEIRLPAVD